MAEKTTIARPYARAVFELAEANDALAHWGEALAALAELAALTPVQRLIDAPAVASKQRAEVLIEIAGDALDTQAQNLVRVLSEQHRLNCLADIANEFETLRAAAEKVVDVEMRTAVDVDDARHKSILDGLERHFGCNVRLHCVIDDSVVGGAVLQAGDTVIDDSIRGRLNKLAAAMTL